jgi:hypothetical protein
MRLLIPTTLFFRAARATVFFALRSFIGECLVRTGLLPADVFATFFATCVLADFETRPMRPARAGLIADRGDDVRAMWSYPVRVAATWLATLRHSDATAICDAAAMGGSGAEEYEPDHTENQNRQTRAHTQQGKHRGTGFCLARLARRFNDLSVLFCGHADLRLRSSRKRNARCRSMFLRTRCISRGHNNAGRCDQIRQHRRRFTARERRLFRTQLWSMS